MCVGDEGGNPLQYAQLFKLTDSSMDVTYKASAARLKECLIASRYKDLATGMHSLRIGGAPDCMSSLHGWEDVSPALRKWRSSVRLVYIFATEEIVEWAGYEVGREAGPTSMKGRLRLGAG